MDVLNFSDGIKPTGATDEELNQELIPVSGSANDGGRGRSPAESPEDQIKEISPTSPLVESSPAFTASSYLSTSEAPADPVHYRRSPEDQIEKSPPLNPLVESSRSFTPTTYASTSEALANDIWSRRSQYQMSYPMAQSRSYRAPFRQVCSSHP
jgi:hypothetical protein